jgi:Fur family zinc uptake transcriptional regulator
MALDETGRRPNGWLEAAIRTTLARARKPLTGIAIAGRLQRRHGQVHRSAVFRTLERLLAAGMVRRIELLSAYALDRGTPRIDLVCRACGSFTELNDDDSRSALASLARASGVEPNRFIVEVSGDCARCMTFVSAPGQR